MRNKIITLLKNSKIAYQELMRNYKNDLPVQIIKTCNEKIDFFLPREINKIIDLINLVENEKHKPINNIDDGIEFFYKDEIQKSIEKVLDSKEVYSSKLLKKENVISVKFIKSISEIESIAHYLSLQIGLGKVNKGNT
ncbi:MAG: hypothetical protein PWP52_1016 [Bacteroidales bacterium]|nr:hypothetical protein [Bacteroidales bacterium]